MAAVIGNAEDNARALKVSAIEGTRLFVTHYDLWGGWEPTTGGAFIPPSWAQNFLMGMPPYIF